MLSAVFAVVSLAPSFIKGAPQLYNQAGPSPTSSVAPLSSATVQTSSTPLVMAYYPDWSPDSFAPEIIDFERLDWVDFAFAIPDKNCNITWDNPESPELLDRLVKAAHSKGTKVKLSIGGWSGSTYFSRAVSSQETRTIFVDNIVRICKQHNVDGVDIDWEYPGQPGNAGNIISSSDSANYLAFLQLLRESWPSAIITAATSTTTWAGSDGQPMEDVSAFAQVLDWINIMNYDTWGVSSTPGANAPLYDGCGDSTQPQSNAVAAYDTWTSGGFRPSQLVLGVPAYGYVSRSTENTLRTRHARRSLVPDQDGQITFSQLVEQGALTANVVGQPQVVEQDPLNLIGEEYVGWSDFERKWDGCSATPYLVNSIVKQVVSYDDPESIAMKAQFVKVMGMAGVNFWEVTGDWNWVLIDTVRTTFGR